MQFHETEQHLLNKQTLHTLFSQEIITECCIFLLLFDKNVMYLDAFIV